MGVIIDSNLSFKEHIYACVKKGYGISNLISTNLRNLQRNALVTLYKCYVRPTLEYNSVIFHRIIYFSLMPLKMFRDTLISTYLACIILIMLKD